MLFDTDILIWVQRGNGKAANWVDQASSRYISVQTYLEMIQDAENSAQLRETKKYLFAAGFTLLPFTEQISHRAMVYLEEYGLSHRMGAGDAIIAATAVEQGLPLATGRPNVYTSFWAQPKRATRLVASSQVNAKHFRAIRDLELKVFKP